MPCGKLYAYSYLDPEHGDKPQGARVEVCRRWAAESGKQAWHNVLLTDSGTAQFRREQTGQYTSPVLGNDWKTCRRSKNSFYSHGGKQ